MSWSVKFLKKFPQTSKQPLTSLSGTKRRQANEQRIPWKTDSPLTALDIPQKYTSKTLVVLRLTANMGNTAPQNFVSLLRLCNSSFELIEINFYANLNSDRTQLKHFPANPLSPSSPLWLPSCKDIAYRTKILLAVKLKQVEGKLNGGEKGTKGTTREWVEWDVESMQEEANKFAWGETTKTGS